METLNGGGSYIVRIAPDEIDARDSTAFRATAITPQIAAMDVVLICVPTPLNDYHEPDLELHDRDREVDRAASARGPAHRAGEHDLSRHHRRGCGAVARIGQCRIRCVSARQPDERGFYVAFSPEREDPGNDTVARRDIPKVVGGWVPWRWSLACALYGSIFNRTVPVSSPAAAEMTKLLENIYRCVNIALVNELKQLCQRMDIDIFEVIDAAKTKPFGFQAFYPGPGLGGHCIPIDPFYLSWKAKQFDFRTRFIELAGEVNIAMPYYVMDQTIAALNEQRKALNGSKILVLGWPTSATSTIFANLPR